MVPSARSQSPAAAAAPSAPVAPAPVHRRARGLDVLRGLTVAWLLVVVYTPTTGLRGHARWFGWDHSDVFFPLFVLLAGMGLALQARDRVPCGRLVRRFVVLVVLGLLVNAWLGAGPDLTQLRVTGVLQRIAVAGLAARNDPTRLNFLLVDFKGGAAFAACERLPHTIGTISNLDEQLADRAIRALEAELGRRQRVFAAAGADIDTLDAYLATKPAEPMPRLLFVVDEFAMLAKDFPDVLTSLVAIAAVGRTLGVHMILATPLKLLQTLEDYVGGIGLVTCHDSQASRVAPVAFDDLPGSAMGDAEPGSGDQPHTGDQETLTLELGLS